MLTQPPPPPTLPKDRLETFIQRLPAPLGSAVALFSGQGARAGYLAAADQAAVSLANFVATLMLARNVSPTELGVYGVGFTALRLARAVQEGIAIQPLNAYGSSMDDQEFRRYASSVSLIQVALAALSASAVMLLGWFFLELGKDVVGPTLIALGPAFLCWQLQEYIRRMLYTRGQVLLATINSLLANFVRLAVMLWLLRQGQLSGGAGLHAIALGSLAALIPALWQTRQYWCARGEPLLKTWRRNWSFGRWIMGGMLANWAAVEFYPVLTAGMISFAAAGAYRAIQNLVAPVLLLLRAADTFLTPRAARAYHISGQPALRRMVRLTYWATGVPILGFLAIISLLPTTILRLLYGETYVPYSNAMLEMALFYALMYAYWPLQTAFKAARLSRPIFVANLAAIAAMFTLGIWMIQRWGVYGTIYGQALNAAILFAILVTAWSRFNRAVSKGAGA